MIQDQIKLPIKVAFEVATQGIRIRFGRSVVTVMGVLLGVAFLMSILTSQVIKEGVSEEQELRNETQRMLSFLTAEMGPPRGRTLGVIQIGSINDFERRFLNELKKQDVGELRWHATRGALDPPQPVTDVVQRVELQETAENASALLIFGEGEVPQVDWQELIEPARNRVVCVTRRSSLFAAPEGLSVVSLQRELREEEIAKREAEARRDRFRTRWIIIISLLVTVICISNSLLMSVTERFKEIGTMKCLGALSSFIRRLFLIESSLIGLAGSLIGSVFGCVFSIIMYSFTFGAGMVLGSLSVGVLLLYLLMCTVAGLVLSVLAAIYPANFAANMLPGVALRTNI